MTTGGATARGLIGRDVEKDHPRHPRRVDVPDAIAEEAEGKRER